MIAAIVISSIAFGWAHIYFRATGSFLEPRLVGLFFSRRRDSDEIPLAANPILAIS